MSKYNLLIVVTLLSFTNLQAGRWDFLQPNDTAYFLAADEDRMLEEAKSRMFKKPGGEIDIKKVQALIKAQQAADNARRVEFINNRLRTISAR